MSKAPQRSDRQRPASMRLFWGLASTYGLLLLIAIGIAVWNPLAFQRANIARPAAEAAIPDLAVSPPFDADKIIGAIPYRGGEVWSVQPSAKYEATILGGSGNCATKTFGLAYHLGETGIDYQIIDLVHPETFLTGYGHTLMRVDYLHNGEQRLGLIDLLEGGVPFDGERYFDVADLVDGAIPNSRIDPLNERKDDHARYFGEFLDGVVLAYRPAAEVNRYHDFLSSVYVPFGHEKLEKYLYDGVALLFGVLPSLHVTDYDRLLETTASQIYPRRIALWTLRSAFIMLPLFLLIGWRLRRSTRRHLADTPSLQRQLDLGTS
jgi:hypothetical protein